MDQKSYGEAKLCPVGAMSAAASFVARDWDERNSIGYAGRWTHPDAAGNAHVFQVKAGDGSRFLVWADKWGNVGQFSHEDEIAASRALNVETHEDNA